MGSTLKYFVVIIALFITVSLKAQPWIGTNDIWLRSDIEALANIGIIKVPITTYPLMWSGIIKDLDNTTIEEVPESHKKAFWRVNTSAKNSFARKSRSHLRISTANSSQLIRSFGDSSREKFELSAKNSGMNKSFAWSINVTHVSESEDEDSIRLDNSHASFVLGNWVTSIGYVEKWWGPGLFSSNLLSNNSRPPLGISLQRNYSNTESNLLFNWLGPWTASGVVARLDDSRSIKDAKLAGAYINFKPLESLEVAFRATTLWGGDGRSEDFSSLIESFFGQAECDLPQNFNCDELYGVDNYSSNGDRIAGLDFKWNIPVSIPVSIYFSSYGESESEIFPTKGMQQFGISGSLNLFGESWSWYVESSDSSLDGSVFNSAYESPAYSAGYRYFSRSIGSTFDNDSEVLGFGLIGSLNRRSRFSFMYLDASINVDGNGEEVNLSHSLTASSQNLRMLKVTWNYQTNKYGELKLTLESLDETENLKVELESYRLSFDWNYYLN